MNYTYKEDYASRREDGRLTSSLPAFMEFLRRGKPELALPEDLTAADYPAWREKVRQTLKTLLALPPLSYAPPKMLQRVQREGYRTEKWEFYPGEVAAVPALVQIPDSADAAHPAPLMLCFPGAIHNKEFVAGEPLLDIPSARLERYPERNRMGLYMAQNGMVSVTVDPISIAETAMRVESESEHGCGARNELIYGLLEYGTNYVSLSLYQALCIYDYMKTLPFIDKSRIGCAAHSLGTETALPMTLYCDDIQALVFNDFLCDQRERYESVTETDGHFTGRGSDLAHVLPGKFRYFGGYETLCAACAPAYLALNEGGAEEHLSTVRRAYRLAGAEDRLQISYYPAYADPASRVPAEEKIPLQGLSPETYFKYTGTDAPDHSFRREPSLRLIKRAFHLE